MLLTRSRYVEELKTLGMSHRVLGFNDTAIDCAGMGSPKKRARIRGGYCQFTYTVHSGEHPNLKMLSDSEVTETE
jgi:hypothetical protein